MNARLFLIPLLAICMGFTSCQSDTVVVADGPKAVELMAAKDEHIKGLVQQVKDEHAALLLEQASSAKTTSNAKSALKAHDYLEESLAKQAIGFELGLILARQSKDDAKETAEGYERVVAIITGQRDKANELYNKANKDIETERAAKEAKDKEIVTRDAKLKAGSEKMAQLEIDVKAEKLAHVKDVQSTIDRLTKERDEAEQKSIMFWLGIGSVGLIIGGIVLIAMTSGRLIVEGSILSVGGGLVILLRLGYLSLISQPWFPIAAGIVAAIIIATIGWAIYRLWISHKLDVKKTQAIQDMRDEAAAKGNTTAIDQLDEHLEYRMGQDGSFWQKHQVKTEVALGLVDPKGEAKLAGKS